MKLQKQIVAAVAICLSLLGAVARAASDELTITGVISKVDPQTRIATVTPANGEPIVVQFAFNAGGPCDRCLGSGRSGPTFSQAVTEGSTWTLTYSSSFSPGAAKWFPGGTVNTVYRAVRAKTP